MQKGFKVRWNNGCHRKFSSGTPGEVPQSNRNKTKKIYPDPDNSSNNSSILDQKWPTASYLRLL